MYQVQELLRCDAYKLPESHQKQYNQNLTRLVSYFTPRMTRIKEFDKLTMFYLQMYIKRELIEGFNETFFNIPLKDVLDDYIYTTSQTFNIDISDVDASKVEALHKLGYLPIRIDAIPEGEQVNIKVPMFMVTNTHPDFVWLVNALESNISCNCWYPMLIGNVGIKYRNVVEHYYNKTVDNAQDKISKAISEFGLRGAKSYETAISASMGMMLSHKKNASIPAIKTMHNYYNDADKSIPLGEFGQGMISTEHSVICSNFAIDGDERTFIHKLITELYPKGNVSLVADSYDFFNIVNNVLPTLKDEILNREGMLCIRPDSGEIVQMATETVFRLWDIFGGTTNSKGYKVLDPHIRVIYGDSVTITRAKKIYQVLEENGFSSGNVLLGAGSFSMQCIEGENGELYPFTRDSMGIAVKSTYCEYLNKDGSIRHINIFKDPITDTGHFKKSQKGCCLVIKDANGDFSYTDELTFDEAHNSGKNEMITVFENGKLIKNYSIRDIRNKLWNNKF